MEESTNNEVDPLDAYMDGLLASEFMSSCNVEGPTRQVQGKREFEFEVEEEDLVTGEDVYVSQPKRKRTIPEVDHTTIPYSSFKKNLYIEVSEIRSMTEEQVLQYQQHFLEGVKTRGQACPRPIMAFSQCGLTERVLQEISNSAFTKPTPIQAQAIPAIMSGRDVIGIAKTGSGKTLAYLLPMFRHILAQPPLKPGEGPIALLMAPTRELAVQIHTTIKKFAKKIGIRSVCVYGGALVSDQIAELKRGAEVVVCTPGRMTDMLSLNSGRIVKLRRVTFIVIDEADCMFSLGFEPQIMRIIANVRPDKQTVMFSATFPQKVENVARKILDNPVEIVVGERGVVCEDVHQHIEVVLEEHKIQRLLELLRHWHGQGLIIIFVSQQNSADVLFQQLTFADYPCLSLHGGKDQADRYSSIQDFKDHHRTILVATSVAARGLDVEGVCLVINYDVPTFLEDYVHRVGRTGRAGNKGTAYTFISPSERQYAPALATALKKSGVELPPAFQELLVAAKQDGVKSKKSGGYDRGFKFDASEESSRQKAARIFMLTQGDESAVVTTPTLPPAPPISSADMQLPEGAQLSAAEKARQYAAHINQVASSLQRVNISAQPCDELEINDYPLPARIKATRKDALQDIMELTGCDIIARGVYVPPGRSAEPGKRKLYLYIEGPTQSAISIAKETIKQSLEDVLVVPRQGRYSVL